MKKWIVLFIVIIAALSCTNPEVNFPEETKKEVKKSIPYKIPTVLAYGEDLSPVIFYYFISLARANGAEDAYLIPVKDNKQKIMKMIDKLTQFYGEKPVLIGVKISIKDYYAEIADRVRTVVLIAPKEPMEAGENLIVFSEKSKEEPKGLDVKEPKSGADDSKNLAIKTEEKTSEVAKEIEWDKMKEILSKSSDEENKFLLKFYKEDAANKKYILSIDLIKEEKERVASIFNSAEQKRLADNKLLSSAFDLIPKEMETEKFKKEILDKLGEEQKKQILKYYEESAKEKKYILKEKMADDEKQAVVTLISQFLPKPETSISFTFPESMKDYNFLAGFMKKILGGDLGATTAEEERLLYFKGKTYPKTKVVLVRIDEANKRNKMSSISNQDGLFSPLIVNAAIPFYVLVSSEKREWKYYFQGLNHSYSFFDIVPPYDAVAEVKSFFSPIDLKNFTLPETIKIPEEVLRALPKIYCIKVRFGAAFEAKPSGNGLMITLPENTPPIQIQTPMGIKVNMQENVSLYLLN